MQPMRMLNMHFGRPKFFFFWGRGVGFEILLGGFGVLTMFPIMPSMFFSCSQVFLNMFPIVSHSKEYIKDVF